MQRVAKWSCSATVVAREAGTADAGTADAGAAGAGAAAGAAVAAAGFTSLGVSQVPTDGRRANLAVKASGNLKQTRKPSITFLHY